jgi:hypothetical protein
MDCANCNYNTDGSCGAVWCPYEDRINYVESPMGWECLRCGKVNSPYIIECDCAPLEYYGVSDGTWSNEIN